MTSSEKPIIITLFHAHWCSHCVKFMPMWDKMKTGKNVYKNIHFKEYEASKIGALSENDRTINGTDVRSLGYPSIKISIMNDEYMYEGRRRDDDIYSSIINYITPFSLKK